MTHLRRREVGDAVVMFGRRFGKGRRGFASFAMTSRTTPMATDLGTPSKTHLEPARSRWARVAGVNCAAIADTRDTDGDGLWDSWEVMGVNGQALPAWGANPRHKDIFVEIDFRRLTLADNQNGLALRMTAAVARQLAGIYADSATTDPATAPCTRKTSVILMVNPE